MRWPWTAALERRLAERTADRLHQQTLLTSILTSLETVQETSARETSANADALIAVAKGLATQAESFSNWLKLFQTTSAPTSSVVRDDDEVERENALKGLPADWESIPAELRLAYTLHHDPNLLGLNAPMTP